MNPIPRVPVVNLGLSGLRVSRLGFGTFDFGVPALHISAEEGGRILVEAHRLGVTFWDTSDDYGSHPHVAWALKHVPREEVVISTKTSAHSVEETERALKRSLQELGTDYVDIFLLHFVQSAWMDGCCQVLEQMTDLKRAGLVRAIGVSTHSVAVVRGAARFAALDVIMTICCSAAQAIIKRFPEHIPLEDGSMEEMLEVTELAHRHGKGTCAMKVLGNGISPLARRYRSAIRLIGQLDFVDTLVIGMKSLDELGKNVAAILSSSHSFV